MNLPLTLNLRVFLALLLGLAQTRHTSWSLAKKVCFALVPGASLLAKLLSFLPHLKAVRRLVIHRRIRGIGH